LGEGIHGWTPLNLRTLHRRTRGGLGAKRILPSTATTYSGTILFITLSIACVKILCLLLWHKPKTPNLIRFIGQCRASPKKNQGISQEPNCRLNFHDDTKLSTEEFSAIFATAKFSREKLDSPFFVALQAAKRIRSIFLRPHKIKLMPFSEAFTDSLLQGAG
jgi:hypothetical protein